jgi:hypothetical protein
MDRQEAIKDMIDSITKGNSADVQSKFNAIMMGRASDAVNDYKQELSQSVFKNPEMQAMGLADGEEHILEVDPAATPETVGNDDE